MNIFQFFEKAWIIDPNKIFLIEEESGQQLTYGQFREKVKRVAYRLIMANVNAQDRVAIILPRSIDAVVLFFAVNFIGAVPVIVESTLKTEGLKKQLENLNPKLVISENNKKRFLNTDPARIIYNFRPSDYGDLATIIYSSGTTGEPKGVMISQRTLIFCGEGFPYWFGLNENDRLYTCLSLGHINALGYSLMGAIGVGATLILGSSFQRGEGFWKKMRASGATIVNMLGTMLESLRNQPACPEEKQHALRFIANGHVIADRQLHCQLEERFNAPIIISYGSSESPLGGFIMPLDSCLKGNNYVGRKKSHPYFGPSWFFNVLKKEDGTNIIQPYEEGGLWVCNPSTSAGYWNNPQLTSENFINGWYRTGDWFMADNKMNFIYKGRKDDRLRCRGNNFFPQEVEIVLNSHPLVAESAVIGVKRNLADDLVKAFIVVKEGTALTESDLIIFCGEKLPSYKIPSQWEFRQSLPKTETGKIERKKLI